MPKLQEASPTEFRSGRGERRTAHLTVISVNEPVDEPAVTLPTVEAVKQAAVPVEEVTGVLAAQRAMGPYFRSYRYVAAAYHPEARAGPRMPRNADPSEYLRMTERAFLITIRIIPLYNQPVGSFQMGA